MTKTLSIRSLDIPAIHRFGIGFDSVLDELMRTTATQLNSNYPPHNVIKTGDETVTIEVAIAGFHEGEISIVIENQTLVVSGSKEKIEDLNIQYFHRGISSRDFNLHFTLAEHVEIISASVKNGILAIHLERKIPEEKKPRTVAINYS